MIVTGADVNNTFGSLKFVSEGSFDNIEALIQVMACCPTGGKSLPEPKKISFVDATWL